jgi:hypothetical protein
MSQVVEDDSEEVEVVKLDDDSVSKGDPVKNRTDNRLMITLLLAIARVSVQCSGCESTRSSTCPLEIAFVKNQF